MAFSGHQQNCVVTVGPIIQKHIQRSNLFNSFPYRDFAHLLNIL